jgi:hypothetical protein
MPYAVHLALPPVGSSRVGTGNAAAGNRLFALCDQCTPKIRQTTDPVSQYERNTVTLPRIRTVRMRYIPGQDTLVQILPWLQQ